MLAFCSVVRQFNEMEDELLEIDGNLKKINRSPKLSTATESLAALRAVCENISRIEIEINQMIP